MLINVMINELIEDTFKFQINFLSRKMSDDLFQIKCTWSASYPSTLPVVSLELPWLNDNLYSDQYMVHKLNWTNRCWYHKPICHKWRIYFQEIIDKYLYIISVTLHSQWIGKGGKMALLSPYWKVSQGVYCLFEYPPSKKTPIVIISRLVSSQRNINVVQNLLLNLWHF